jgi:hypothetical protein
MRILFSPGFRAEISIARRIRQPRRQIDHYPFGGAALRCTFTDLLFQVHQDGGGRRTGHAEVQPRSETHDESAER